MADDVEVQDGTVTVQVFADFINRTPRRIQQLSSERKLPRIEKGRIAFLPAVRAFLRYQDELQAMGSKKLDEDARLKAAQANLRELEFQQARGNVFVPEEVISLLETTTIGLKTECYAVGSRAAVDSVGKDAAQIKENIDREVASAFAGFCAKIDALLARAEAALKRRAASKKAASRPVGGRGADTAARAQ